MEKDALHIKIVEKILTVTIIQALTHALPTLVLIMEIALVALARQDFA